MEQNETPETTALSERQLYALPYLVAADSMTEAARLADIGRTTLYRWMEDSEFRKEFQRLRNQASELAFSELKGLMLKAAQVLAEGMEDDNPSIRIRSARTAMEIGIKTNEIKAIEKRLDVIDQAINLKSERQTT